MRTTLNLDEALLSRAHQLSGLRERSALLRAALNALIERESARRLARMGLRTGSAGCTAAAP